MQIHQWSEIYLQTLQKSSCRYISGLKCICKRSRYPHADTSVVRNASANAPGILMQIHQWSEMYLQTLQKSSCRYISGLKCICKCAKNPHADTSVVRNVSANAPGILMQIHQWSEMYLQTLQKSSCGYSGGKVSQKVDICQF